MLVQITSLDNGSGMNTNLDVYLCYNTQQKLFETKPFCRIDEADFCEMLTDKQIEKMQDGTINFNVPKSKLTELAKTIFP